jgi:acid phosphatase (class A)
MKNASRDWEKKMRYTVKGRSMLRAAAVLIAYAVAAAGCANIGGQHQAAVPEIRPGILAGYLEPAELPDSLALVPPPPAAGTAALAEDEEAARKGLALKDTPQWRLASEDADIMFPHAAGTFACAVDAPITEKDTPHLYVLLRRVFTDAGYSTWKAKQYYKRPRPFVVNGEPTCASQHDRFLSKNTSYPSGHAAIGWAWALILAEIAPDRADAILGRGRSYGDGRVVCNVHWRSDVIEGRTLGSAAVARLHANSTFQSDLEAARGELAAVRARGLKPQRDCAAEALALAGR